MKRLTLFTWGYYGWGNATEQFIEAVDAVETSRGFKPAIFVDVRIQRSGRAEGFKGAAFENLLPAGRHRWMKELGNKAIVSRSGPMQIAESKAATDLLDLAVDSAKSDARVLFFCGCAWPKSCHRAIVAKLVLKAAKKRGVKVQIVEWPGGKPKRIDLEVTPATFAAVRKGRMAVPLGKCPELAEVAAVPWGSIATLKSNGHKLYRLLGPVLWQRGEWCQSVLWRFQDPEAALSEYKAASVVERHKLGLEPESV